ncbi:hypothetical protein SAMN02745866_02257 [Alteromonadaceae bacterium Bs31]|nr:hypothetical protein SAMN02745866_02257 [Alteromonadaceae bacterium Bs31]
MTADTELTQKKAPKGALNFLQEVLKLELWSSCNQCFTFVVIGELLEVLNE